MRTTLSIDEDVLQAAKTMADHQQRSLGEVISELARRGLTPRPTAPKMRNGVSLLPSAKDNLPVTPEIVRQLRDETP